ncbi:MAG: hypothetical protein H6710_14900 [Myxococcales bacterium]|nr:hypothetical protein [Myxococcales bacterium]MCB9702036.1 hypothetical protein [Myxococcales bacterium]
MPLHIGVLCSEPPTEGDDTAALDGRSAQDLAESIRRLGHRATVIPADDELSLALALRREVLDGCLLATHGDLGGSGRLQAQLRRCCLPHVGPSAAAVTLAYDKLRARDRLSRCNLPVPTSLAFGAGLQTPRRELAYLGWPAILKPRRGSLGRGVLRLESAQEIADLVDDELAHGGEILVERATQGVEVQVVLLDGVVLGAMQVERSRDLQEIEAMTCPPDLSTSMLHGLEHLARHAADALDLGRGICRVDILVSDRHNEQILEVEALPPLHRDGVVARIARAAGIPHPRLVELLLGGLPRVERLEVPSRPEMAAPAFLPA